MAILRICGTDGDGQALLHCEVKNFSPDMAMQVLNRGMDPGSGDRNGNDGGLPGQDQGPWQKLAVGSSKRVRREKDAIQFAISTCPACAAHRPRE